MTAVEATETKVEPAQFRDVLGHYPTGVVVVTAMRAVGEPAAMAIGSFVSVSLDPPLVGFLPDKSSSSWAGLQEAGTSFCVNVLSEEQADVCQQVASRKEDKLAEIPWRSSAAGNPILEDALAYIDCTVHEILDAGDHVFVIGRVEELETQADGDPLVFFRGAYGAFRPSVS